MFCLLQMWLVEQFYYKAGKLKEVNGGLKLIHMNNFCSYSERRPVNLACLENCG